MRGGRPLRVLSSVGANRRKFWLMAASALTPLSLGVSEPALAQCVPPPGGYGVPISPTCSAGTYNTNINYDTNNGLGGFPINLTLQSGVIVNRLLPTPSLKRVFAFKSAAYANSNPLPH